MIMLDRLAQRYGCLPSDVLHRADTLDIQVLTTSSAWDNHQHKNSGSGKVPPMIPESRLQQMMQSVKQTKQTD